MVISLGKVDTWSDVTPGRDILWPSVILLQVSLTFDQMSPRKRHLVARWDTNFGQVDIRSDLWVRLAFDQMSTHAETSCGQARYYFRLG